MTRLSRLAVLLALLPVPAGCSRAPQAPAPRQALATLKLPDRSQVQSMCYAPDGRAARIGDHAALWTWDLESDRAQQLLSLRGTAYGLAFSPDARLLACSARRGGRREKKIYIWDIQRKR